MLLCDILKNVDCKVFGKEDVVIKKLTHNSEEVTKGDVFFCLKGCLDGHDFAKVAEKMGASVIVTEEKLSDINCCQVVVKSTREAMSLCAANYFGNPSKDLIIVGVTGTNGKTTSTYLLKSVIEVAGKSVAIIGTNGVIYNGKKIETNMTTPDPILLQEILSKLKSEGVEYVCIEMSAHAAHLQKLRGVMTDIILFTNLTQDHLDYFENMKNYGEAKLSLFNKSFADYAVINYDDAFGKKIADRTNLPYLSYSLKNLSCDIKASNIEQTKSGSKYVLNFQSKKIEIDQKLYGNFNISNVLGVVGAGLLLGFDLETVKRGIERVNHVPGRFNVKEIDGVKYVIDYAHTPDGLENILYVARSICENNLISVFGCGGNRDKTKRSIMGNISSNLADYSVITSDNPRFEEPSSIIADIVSGLENDNFITETDRRKAIIKASRMAKPGDVVVISGKGAEEYIDQNGKKKYYSDYDVLKEIECLDEFKL